MPPEIRFPSPTGAFHFLIHPWEVRMSLWIESPQLFDTVNQTSLFEFADPNWSLDHAQWLTDCSVKITLRKYPGAHSPASFDVILDCSALTATYQAGPPMSFPEIKALLESLAAR